jgi:hypothetical protein
MFFILLCSQVHTISKIVIADKGAGNDLIEHTLPTVAPVASMSVDYPGLQVVMATERRTVDSPGLEKPTTNKLIFKLQWIVKRSTLNSMT